MCDAKYWNIQKYLNVNKFSEYIIPHFPKYWCTLSDKFNHGKIFDIYQKNSKSLNAFNK